MLGFLGHPRVFLAAGPTDLRKSFYTLAWPTSDAPALELSAEELTLLLGGIDLSKTQRRPWLDRRPNASKTSFTTIHETHGFGMIKSLRNTSRRSGLDPAKWLEDVLRRIPTATTANLHELLPGHWKPATA